MIFNGDGERSGGRPREEFRHARSRPIAHSRIRDLGHEKFHANAFAAAVFVVGVCADSSGQASAASHRQFPHHDLRSGPGSYQEAWFARLFRTRKRIWQLLASIMPIARLAPCPGTPAPGTWLIAMSDGGATIYYPVAVNPPPNVHDQGTESCLSAREDNVRAMAPAYVSFPCLLLQKFQDRVEELDAVLLEQNESVASGMSTLCLTGA